MFFNLFATRLAFLESGTKIALRLRRRSGLGNSSPGKVGGSQPYMAIRFLIIPDCVIEPRQRPRTCCGHRGLGKREICERPFPYGTIGDGAANTLRVIEIIGGGFKR